MVSRSLLKLVVFALVALPASRAIGGGEFNVDIVEIIEGSDGKLLLKLRTNKEQRHGGRLERPGDWEFYPGEGGKMGRLVGNIEDGTPAGAIVTQALTHWTGETTISPKELEDLGASGPIAVALNGRILTQISFDGERVTKRAAPKLSVVILSIESASRDTRILKVQTAEMQGHGGNLIVDGAVKVVPPRGDRNGTISFTVAEADPDGMHTLGQAPEGTHTLGLAHWTGEIELSLKALKEAGVKPTTRSKSFDLIINGAKLAVVKLTNKTLKVVWNPSCPAELTK